MILQDSEIWKKLQTGELVIDPVNHKYIQPAGYDLHLHPDILVYAHKHVPGVAESDYTQYDYQYPDTDNSRHFLEAVISEDGYPLQPGECILGRTVEKLKFPANIVGRLDGCSSHGRIFLTIHSTAGKFDPLFSGTATLEIKNDSPRITVLSRWMRIAQMEFHYTHGYAEYGYDLSGRYQEQVDPTATRDPRSGTPSKVFDITRNQD